MSDHSNIEWTDTTWNPTTGCTRVSPGCDNCYAVRMTRRCEGSQNESVRSRYIGLTVKNPAGQRHFNGVVRWHEDVLEAPLHWRKPRRVFVNSMSDLFHKDVPFEFIDKVFAVMALCPQHTFQVLTKRPERMAEYMAGRADGASRWACVACRLDQMATTLDGRRPSGIYLDDDGWPLPNVWLGTSVENQEQADKRIPHLLKCPAAVRFLSVEPLLGPIDLTRWLREPLEVTYDGLDLRSLDAQVGEHRGQDGQDITLAGQLPSSDRLPTLSNALVVPTDSSAERGGDPFDHRPIGRVDREANTVGIPRLAPPVEVSLAVEQAGDVGNRREISRDGHGRRHGARSGTSNRNAVRGEPSLNGRSTQADNSADLREGHTALVKAGDRVHSPNSTVPMIDWLIIGGESGPGARPMHPDWARAIRDQCAAAGVPFFFKQWGEWAPGDQSQEQRVAVAKIHAADRGDAVRFIGENREAVFRVGKHAAGRLLDGREHNDMPRVAAPREEALS